MWSNKLKTSLAAGETAYGPFLRLPGPAGVEIAASAGFDFVIIDLEHSALDLQTAEAMILAGRAEGITPLVRVPEASRAGIERILDIGAHGVVVPMVDTEGQARVVGEATKYPPLGQRGLAGPTRSDAFGALPLGDALVRLNHEVLTIAQVETRQSLENLEAIARQPGIDVLFVGPLDLSQSLGVPGQVAHPSVVAASRRVVAVARAHGKWAGIFAGTPEAAAFWRAEGMSLIATGLDSVVLRQGYLAMGAALKQGR